jgi:hypothetical protein
MTAGLARMSSVERDQLRRKLAEWHDDPVLCIRELFTMPDGKPAAPDAWQEKALRAVARDPRVAMSACKGPGKSALLAWVIWWFLLTRQDAQVMVCSITKPNLADGLWKELAIWQSRSALLLDLFEHGGERIVNRDSPKTWWCSARGWAQDADATAQANSLAGFHGEHVMVALDEIGDYPGGVLSAAEGIFQNTVEAKLVVAGNPTSPDGPLYHIVTRYRGLDLEARQPGEAQQARRWTVITITGDPDDPMRSPRIDIENARQAIADHGRDDDWVRVNILGLFPRVGSDKLLGPEDVLKAEQRGCTRAEYIGEPIVFGLDVAREGDDRTVLYKRQGSVLFRPWVWHGKDGTQVGDLVARVLREDEKDAYDYLIVDIGGPGCSAYDRLRVLGFDESLISFDFGGSPLDERYADRGTEAWFAMKAWVLRNGCLPTGDGELSSELTTRKYGYRVAGKRTRFCLEPKKELKKRGLPSPDKADGLALTFGAPLGPRPRRPAPNSPEAALYASVPMGRYRTEDDGPTFRD